MRRLFNRKSVSDLATSGSQSGPRRSSSSLSVVSEILSASGDIKAWKQLGFSPERPLRFEYCYLPAYDRKSFVVEVSADFDGDTVHDSVWEIRGRTGRSGPKVVGPFKLK